MRDGARDSGVRAGTAAGGRCIREARVRSAARVGRRAVRAGAGAGEDAG